MKHLKSILTLIVLLTLPGCWWWHGHGGPGSGGAGGTGGTSSGAGGTSAGTAGVGGQCTGVSDGDAFLFHYTLLDGGCGTIDDPDLITLPYMEDTTNWSNPTVIDYENCSLTWDRTYSDSSLELVQLATIPLVDGAMANMFVEFVRDDEAGPCSSNYSVFVEEVDGAERRIQIPQSASAPESVAMTRRPGLGIPLRVKPTVAL